MGNIRNRNCHKSFRIQTPIWVTASAILLFASTVMCSGEVGERYLNLTVGDLTASFDLNQKGDITSLCRREVDIVSPGWSRPVLFKVGLVENSVSRYFDNTDFESFRYERIDGGLRFYYDTLHGRELKVVATMVSN